MCKYADWDEFHLTCGAEINGICTPAPFNFKTIDDFYTPNEAEILKREIKKEFPDRDTATVVEVLDSKNSIVHDYAQFLFDNDYSLYSAKQWGVSPSEIDPCILKRVPLRFNYEIGYFDDEYQVMPHISFTAFFERLLMHPNITIKLNTEALEIVQIKAKKTMVDGQEVDYPIVFTGALDELFDCCYGELPYRSLKFKWVHEDIESKQDMPVVAYPQAPDFVRIIEYKKLPVQDVRGTTYEIEYSLPYNPREKNEPYYPLITAESQKLYKKYSELAAEIENLYICGRLGDFKYYNMDQALEKAIEVSGRIVRDRGVS